MPVLEKLPGILSAQDSRVGFEADRAEVVGCGDADVGIEGSGEVPE